MEKNKEKKVQIKPSGILHTVVPKTFLEKFPKWDIKITEKNKGNPKVIYV